MDVLWDDDEYKFTDVPPSSENLPVSLRDAVMPSKRTDRY